MNGELGTADFGGVSYDLQDGFELGRSGGAVMGEMKRAIAREQAAWRQGMQDEKRMKSTLVIAAAIMRPSA
jgi:hypothetical protein